MIKLTPCASPPLNAAGIEVKALFFKQAPGDKFINVYASYNDGQSWVPLHIGLPSVPSLQQVRDMDRNIYVNSGSFEDAHMYLRSADGNNMTVAFYANADGGAIQAGNANGLSSLNLQPEGGLLNYGGYEVATKNWTLGQGYINAETDPTVPAWVKAITNTQILSWTGKQDALGFTPESVANKSTTTALGNSNILYPTQRAVKTYVDNQVTTINANFIPNTQKGVANGVATLGADGKIPNAQIPALAITDTSVVATEAAMLALVAEVGDVAVRSDINKTFILKAAPATTLGNWVELKSPTITTTDQLAEGSTNLYFTTVRARAALSASAPLSYNSSTGSFSIAKADSITNGYLSAADWVIFNAKEPAFAKNTGFNKNFGTVSGTVAQGDDSRIVNGQTAFGWGNHAGLYSPLGHVHSGADITSGTIAIARLPTGTTASTVSLGNHNHAGVYEPAFTTLPIAKGGTNLSALGTAQQLLRVNAGATALEYFTAPWLTGNQSITVTATGAVTGSASGTTSISLPLTIASGVITNANINAAAAIAQTKMAALTANRVMLTDASGFATASSVTNATLNFLDATSSIQTQLNSKVSLTSLSAVAPLSYNNTTGAFSISQASASVNGYMSAADKAKLDGIAAGANNYTHPNSGVAAGTYNSVTVNAQGHITGGSNVGYITTETQTFNSVTALGNNSLQNISIGNVSVGNNGGQGNIDIYGSANVGNTSSSLRLLHKWNGVEYPVQISATPSGAWGAASAGLSFKAAHYNGFGVQQNNVLALSPSGIMTLPQYAGSGTRLMTVDNNGDVGTTTLPGNQNLQSVTSTGATTSIQSVFNGGLIVNNELHLHSIGAARFSIGDSDQANYSYQNFVLNGWNGWGFRNLSGGGPYPNQVVGFMDFRNAFIDMKGGFKVNGTPVLTAESDPVYSTNSSPYTTSYYRGWFGGGSGNDYNNYTTAGTYTANWYGDIAGMVNAPSLTFGGAYSFGTLKVTARASTGSGNVSIVEQELNVYSADNPVFCKKFVRFKLDVSWTAWQEIGSTQWLQNAFLYPYAQPQMDTMGVDTGGGFATGNTKYVSSSNYTVQPADYFVVCTGICTLTLPDPSQWPGRILEIKSAFKNVSNVKSEVNLNGSVYDAELQVTRVISNTTGQRLKIQAAYSSILGNYVWEVMDLNNLNH